MALYNSCAHTLVRSIFRLALTLLTELRPPFRQLLTLIISYTLGGRGGDLDLVWVWAGIGLVGPGSDFQPRLFLFFIFFDTIVCFPGTVLVMIPHVPCVVFYSFVDRLAGWAF